MASKSNKPPQPELRPVKVSPNKLLLWPNNPRLYRGEAEGYSEDQFIDPEVQRRTRKQISDKLFRIEELKNSLRRNGFLPVDYIFVRKYGELGHYVVLEGNRRVTAITEVLEEDGLDLVARGSMEQLECMEITNDLPDDELERLISRLLGVRHHGALKQWTPFAKAAHALNRYREIIGQDGEGFSWDEGVANQVAEGLCLTVKELRELIATHQTMLAMSATASVAEVQGVESQHYSLFCDSLIKGSPQLRDFLPIDQETFRPKDETIERLDKLCGFSKGPGRPNAPITKPGDWRSLTKILKDPDPFKTEQMLQRVMVDGENPRAVYDDRERELKKEDWSSWLRSVGEVLESIELGSIESSRQEQDVVTRLDKLTSSLEG